MPEGHTVHRTADRFNESFGGKKLSVVSPQGRFASGAMLIDGLEMIKAWAVGKQMFLDFQQNKTLRIHLGIYGKWGFQSFESAAPEPVGQVRVRFLAGNQLADLRGPTACDVISKEEAIAIASQLGPDPLNPDPGAKESARFADKVLRSNRAIGLLLMDQSVIAGIGNVYRAELLFRAGINPYLNGSELSVEAVDAIWNDAVKLLKVGVKKGIMITRDELLAKNPVKADRYFVYKREGLPCRNCGTDVSIALMATRKLYWCSSCQS